MNKKGFTVVELIVSFALVMIVVVILVQIVTIVKTLYLNAGIKTELLHKQAIMNRKISQRFNQKDIKAAVRCGAGCLTFIYEDDTSISNIAKGYLNLPTQTESKFIKIFNPIAYFYGHALTIKIENYKWKLQMLVYGSNTKFPQASYCITPSMTRFHVFTSISQM